MKAPNNGKKTETQEEQTKKESCGKCPNGG